MFKCLFEYQEYKCRFIFFKSTKMMEMVKVVKNQFLTFDFEKSHSDRLYILMWFEFQKIECGFMLERSTFVKEDKMVKSQNFWFEKSKFDFD